MSAAWMAGYVADVSYTLGFYRELAPNYLRYACLASGIDASRLAGHFRYCELGCGRGYGTALLAAANPDVEFVGIDFNPSHIAEARHLAGRAKLPNVTFAEMSFGDAAKTSEAYLTNFDVAVLHGVYTWVTPEVRAELVQFLRQKLVAGGIVYISYNSLPGWANAIPIQRILREVSTRSSKESAVAIKEGYGLLKALVEKKSAYVTQNPGAALRIQKMSSQDPSYLAHEFLNAGWQPLFVTDVMADLAEAKLSYIGSASLDENPLELCVPRDLQELVRSAPDAGLRELLKDYVTNKQFRRDLYVKGPQLLNEREKIERFKRLFFASVSRAPHLPEKFKIPAGEFTPNRERISALVAAATESPVSGDALLSAGERMGNGVQEIMLSVLILVQAGILSPAAPPSQIEKGASLSLNELVFDLAITSDTHRFIAAPVLGSAIPASFTDRVIATITLEAANATDREVALAAFDRLAKAGQAFYRDGKPLSRTDENLSSVTELVRDFRQKRLPSWKVLGAVAD